MRRTAGYRFVPRRDPAAARGSFFVAAKRKADTKTTVWTAIAVRTSFPTLLGDLSNIALNQVVLPTPHKTAITSATKPTALQHKAFDLLGVDPHQTVPITVTG